LLDVLIVEYGESLEYHCRGKMKYEGTNILPKKREKRKKTA
jgi:hypothetical protein